MNVLVVRGSEQDLNEFKKRVSSNKSKLDFKKIIPHDRKQRTQVKRQWREYMKNKTSDKNSFYDDFEQYWFNKGGYEWQIKNWGTKWNATTIYFSTVNGYCTYSFDTAWAPPIPIIEKLIDLFPKLEFNFSYEEPGCMFGGEIFKSETGYEHREYELEEEQCPFCEEEGYEVYATKREEEEEYVCPDCGKTFKPHKPKEIYF